MKHRTTLKQLGWFAALWLASIASLTIFAYAIRLAINP